MNPVGADRPTGADTPLGRFIRELIAGDGPIPVRDYMALCLGHPVHGYYRTRDPLGAAGDFITAPEISQMFGELIGLWAAETWRVMGAPNPVRLVELGPGRGTLMADSLRAARALPPFRDAIAIHFVETSPTLRDAQRRTLAASGLRAIWHERIEDLPDGPTIAIANEFFDALPIRQYVRGREGWHERLVGLGPEGELRFGASEHRDDRLLGVGEPGQVLEIAEAGSSVAATVATRLVQGGGAALIVDYGHVHTTTGATLQAVRQHRFVDPLTDPGEADLTAHVDFAALGRAASTAGALVHGPATQGDFLRALGIEQRAERLKAAGAVGIEAALARLTGSEEGQMGALFKVMALSDPSLHALPGLPSPTRQAQGEPGC